MSTNHKQPNITPEDKAKAAAVIAGTSRDTGVRAARTGKQDQLIGTDAEPHELAPEKHVVTARSFINGALVERGEVVQLPVGVDVDYSDPKKRPKALLPIDGAEQKGAPSQELVNKARTKIDSPSHPFPGSKTGELKSQEAGPLVKGVASNVKKVQDEDRKRAENASARASKSDADKAAEDAEENVI